MSTTDSGPLRIAIRKTLAQSAGEGSNARTVAEVAHSTWCEVTTHLAPVIGAGGVDALFHRSLHITRRSFPWLAVNGHNGNSAALFASITTSLASGDPDAAIEASSEFLLNFIELLTSLIGNSLTDRLLGPVFKLSPSPVSTHGGAS